MSGVFRVDRKIRSALRQAGNGVNLFKTIYYNRLYHNKPRFEVYKRVAFSISPTAAVKGTGTLSVGRRRKGYHFFDTVFAVSDKASVN
jgi:hypothetical protein